MPPNQPIDESPIPSFVEFDFVAAKFFNKATRWLLEPPDQPKPIPTPDPTKKKEQLANRARLGIQVHYLNNVEDCVFDAIEKSVESSGSFQHRSESSTVVNNDCGRELYDEAIDLVEDPPDVRPWSFDSIEPPLDWIENGGTTISTAEFDKFTGGFTLKRDGIGQPWYPVKSNFNLHTLFIQLQPLSSDIMIVSRVTPLQGFTMRDSHQC